MGSVIGMSLTEIPFFANYRAEGEAAAGGAKLILTPEATNFLIQDRSARDAVLVTDPFDDLVLANESAARTFDFDLARAQRSVHPMTARRSRWFPLFRRCAATYLN
mgnify:CR=1 FL=1